MRDIVGLYLNPPDRALVLCMDEKRQIQANERTALVLPMQPGQPERWSHDYRRHGTTDLFAALDVRTGRIIGRCRQQHRSIVFRSFLDEVETLVPSDLEVYLILDNLVTHKAPIIRDWLVKRPRRHLHFTPTDASWLNLVECWFSVLTCRRLERTVFTSPAALEQAIHSYIEQNNARPRPFT